MKVPDYPFFTVDLVRGLRDYLPRLARKINGIGSGSFEEWDNATDTVPTAAAVEGDFVKKKTRAEIGAIGSKYILDGWEYAGGVWKERRLLTGG